LKNPRARESTKVKTGSKDLKTGKAILDFSNSFDVVGETMTNNNVVPASRVVTKLKRRVCEANNKTILESVDMNLKNSSKNESDTSKQKEASK
jgi:hypothetical protein